MKLLLIPKAFFGDIVITTSTISAIKASVPAAEISVLLPPAAVSLLNGHPDIVEIIPFDRRKEYKGFAGLRKMATLLRSKRFDHSFSFQRSPRTAILNWLARIPHRVGIAGSSLGFLYNERIPVTERFHEVLRCGQVVTSILSEELVAEWKRLAEGKEPRNLNSFSLSLPVPSRDEVSERVIEVLRGESPYIVLVPGSAWATKRWSAKGYREVAQSVLKRGARVVLVGAPNEREVCEAIAADLPAINLAGQISLPELVRIIGDAAGVVCNDSMALHVASAMKTPCVAVFCATSPAFGFGPWRNRAVVLEKEGLFCKPCRRHGSHSCPVGTNACIDGVKAGSVIAALQSLGALLELTPINVAQPVTQSV